jgi:hypothetical protein
MFIRLPGAKLIERHMHECRQGLNCGSAQLQDTAVVAQSHSLFNPAPPEAGLKADCTLCFLFVCPVLFVPVAITLRSEVLTLNLVVAEFPKFLRRIDGEFPGTPSRDDKRAVMGVILCSALSGSGLKVH